MGENGMSANPPAPTRELAQAARSIASEWSGTMPGWAVEVVEEIDSTNSELMRRIRQGRGQPVLLVAEHQTAGRGRLGRDWASQPGRSLTFSLSLPLTPRDWSGLSLVVGLSLAESLHPQIGLKWPNDLWWQDRKLGGILVETASLGEQRHVVVGVGLNLTAPGPSRAMRTPPAGLDSLLPGISAAAALACGVSPLLMALRAFAQAGFAPWQSRFNSRDVLRDRLLTLSDGSTGWGRGTNSTGEYLVESPSGMVRVSSAELSLRPAEAAGAP